MSTTEVDGFLVDEAGEVVGLVGPEERLETEEEVDAVLAKILRAEAMALAYRREAEAVARNLGRLELEQAARAEHLRARYGPQLEAFARSRLEGKRARTLTLPHGRIAFRRTPGSCRIADMGAAVAWLEEHAPGAVRIKRDAVASDAAAAWDEHGEADATYAGWPAWLEVVPAGERVAITTGLEKGGDA